jgi:hypothetical protein
MRGIKMMKHISPPGLAGKLLMPVFFLLAAAPALQAAEGDLFENLEPLEGAKAALVEIDPNADFGAYTKVKVLDTFVAFRSGWERDQRRTGSHMYINQNDVERIKAGVADLFKQVFTEVLEADNGYETVDESGEDVLLVRPAIIDLDINAPDIATTGRNRTYTTETGAATLYIELYDSVSGQILGRAVDRRIIRDRSERLTWSTRATNTADARRLFKVWAEGLRTFLDSHYSEKQ